MKIKLIPIQTIIVISLLLSSCNKVDETDLDQNAGASLQEIEFGTVFFAQTHVMRPSNENFKLISGRDALIKFNTTTRKIAADEEIKAILTLNGATETIVLNKPETLPENINLSIGKINHNFKDSYTAKIPKEWIQPNLTIEIQSKSKKATFNDLKIGAPNIIVMNMFDISFFKDSPGDYPIGWKEEFETKIPVANIDLKRLKNITFKELTVPAREKLKATRVSSTEDYLRLTGQNFDGEQATASKWNGALKAAAGTRGRYSLFYTNIYGVSSGGQAGGFGGVGNGTSAGIYGHELGHALSLPHWGNNQNYPYKGDMHGITAPDILNKTHAGPVWGFDLVKNSFIPPTVQKEGLRLAKGVYKNDPMQGGGAGVQEEGFIFNHFSDFSVNKMRTYLESHIVVWNPDINSYASWNDDEKKYSKTVANNGVEFAIERNVEVISVMAGISAVTPQANILYPPIGPYNSGIIETFNPTVEADRTKADKIFCPNGGCDASLKIVQGGKTKIVMLPITMDNNSDPLNANSFITKAINLKASEGNVTKVELLLTPDAEKNGLPSNPTILRSWE